VTLLGAEDVVALAGGDDPRPEQGCATAARQRSDGDGGPRPITAEAAVRLSWTGQRDEGRRKRADLIGSVVVRSRRRPAPPPPTSRTRPTQACRADGATALA